METPPARQSVYKYDNVFIVGAGFSSYAGLPLQSNFTESLLEARSMRGQSRIIVDFLSKFVHAAFDHAEKAGAKWWPELEDIFTCVDMSANAGHTSRFRKRMPLYSHCYSVVRG